MTPSVSPVFQLVTNDATELLRRDVSLPAGALRYTHPGLRGLFGGIWRSGRIYHVAGAGCCFGPEIFYSFGADEREAQEAYGRERAVVMAEEADAARRAFAFATPLAESFGGQADLRLVRRVGDRHVVHLFLPAAAVMARFRPHEWFAFWKEQDALFRSQPKAVEPSEKDECAA